MAIESCADRVNLDPIQWVLDAEPLSIHQKLLLVAIVHHVGVHRGESIPFEVLRKQLGYDVAVLRRLMMKLHVKGYLKELSMTMDTAYVVVNTQRRNHSTVAEQSVQAESPTRVTQLGRFPLHQDWRPASGMLSMFLRKKRLVPEAISPEIYTEALVNLQQRYITEEEVVKTELQWTDVYSRCVYELMLPVRKSIGG